jgi:hypothetical protein
MTQVGPVFSPNCPTCLMRCDLDDIGYYCADCRISYRGGQSTTAGKPFLLESPENGEGHLR